MSVFLGSQLRGLHLGREDLGEHQEEHQGHDQAGDDGLRHLHTEQHAAGDLLQIPHHDGAGDQ